MREMYKSVWKKCNVHFVIIFKMRMCKITIYVALASKLSGYQYDLHFTIYANILENIYAIFFYNYQGKLEIYGFLAVILKHHTNVFSTHYSLIISFALFNQLLTMINSPGVTLLWFGIYKAPAHFLKFLKLNICRHDINKRQMFLILGSFSHYNLNFSSDCTMQWENWWDRILRLHRKFSLKSYCLMMETAILAEKLHLRCNLPPPPQMHLDNSKTRLSITRKSVKSRFKFVNNCWQS